MLCGALYPAVLVMAEGGSRTARPGWLDDTAEARFFVRTVSAF